MKLTFITGNAGKLSEVKLILPNVEGMDIDLPEIQEIDARKVVEAKLQSALSKHEGEFIVEDTSLYLNAINGLPGPLIKWFMKTIGNEGLVALAEKFGDGDAEAKTIIGYAKNTNDIEFFEGVIHGNIVSPRGDKGFGWDAIFQPNGQDKTFAEMDSDEKNDVSMRKIATEKLKNWLEQVEGS